MYIARITSPLGEERFLCRGREVALAQATHFAHPSAARRALEAHRAKHPHLRVARDVQDSRDFERVVPS